MLKKCILAAALLVAVSRSSSAGVIGVSISGGSLAGTVADVVVGYLFQANDNIAVTALGMWDEGQDGFTNQGTSEVGLWTLGGSLLATTTVTSTDPLDSGFRFHTVAAVPLTAGQQYVVGGLLHSPDYYRYHAIVTSSPGITRMDSRAVISTSLDFPNQFSGETGSWFGANVQYEPVPEPATLALFGAGLLGAILKLRSGKSA